MTAVLPKTPSFRLDGRRALVTGAGRGIGRAAAAALAEAGAHVTFCARTRNEVEEAATQARAAGYSADELVIDVTDVAAFRAAMNERDAYHVFVNNAGTNRPKHVFEVSIDDYEAVMGLNVRAAYFAAQAVAQRMVAAGIAGSIINMSSQMGHVGGPNRSLYCASKWAMEGFSKAMALDLAAHAVRVNTICPTFIETPLTKPFFDDPFFKASVLSKIKLGRIGTVEDLMGAIVFLAGSASGLMTGSALLVDGGWTAE